MANDIGNEYSNLRFTKEQIFLDSEEALDVAHDFWGSQSGLTADRLTDIDRAFIQGCLLIAVDKSEKAGFLFDLYASAVKAAPKRSVQALVKSLAKKAAKRWFAKIIDNDPKISAVGKAAVQYSVLSTDWRVRWQTGDPTILTDFLIR
jgi:hypothetical protein